MPFEDKPYRVLNDGNKYSLREVGLTHPDNSSFFKIADNGDLHLMSADGLGIIISRAQNCIFLVAETVKFLTKEDGGLRWNNLAFNPKANKYSEPAFVVPKPQNNNIYNGISDFLD